MKSTFSNLFLTLILLLGMALPAYAAEGIETIVPKVVINEIQTNGLGAGTTDQEFIELKNISSETADISGWKLQYIPYTGNLSSAKYFFIFPDNTLLYPGGYLLIAANSYLSELSPRFQYVVNTSFSGLSSGGATVRITNAINTVIDTLGWATKTVIFETNPALIPSDAASIQRRVVDGQTIDTDDNLNDFEKLDLISPQTENIAPVPTPTPEPTAEPTVEPTPEPTVEPTVEPTPEPTVEPTVEPTFEPTPEPTVEPTPEPDNTADSLPISLSELYIDPEAPLTDGQDEWVEMYNPNDEAVDLLGYVVFSGSNLSYKYVFDETLVLESHGYLSLSSADTPLTLANTAGAAKISGPEGQIFDQTEYGQSKTGFSWAKYNGVWQWTSTPTKNEANLITSLPEPIKKAAAAASVQKAVKSSTATTAKSTATKKATTVKASTSNSSVDKSIPLIPAPSPLPSWLLVIIGLIAVLYAGYEYRFELSNKIYQLRKYRETRL